VSAGNERVSIKKEECWLQCEHEADEIMHLVDRLLFHLRCVRKNERAGNQQ